MPLAEVTLAATTSSVGAARGFLSATLREWAATQLEWAAAQVVSELATNAVIHAGTAFTVALVMQGDALRIEVRDGSRRVPRQRHYGLTATTGRGLGLVGALTRDWGISPGSAGKTVWCVLPREQADEDGELDLEAFLTAEDFADLADLKASSHGPAA